MEDVKMAEIMVKQQNGFAASIPGFGHSRNDMRCQNASSAILSRTSPGQKIIRNSANRSGKRPEERLIISKPQQKGGFKWTL